ncbi:hypothetical protein LSH36_187g00020 [Paralvinella palmiformis]|uniref:Uncharacterized protein n=1 Tax=Paralvinella palmiformis TaxID=53620 RepID=A0AAD9JQP9_9ANNE|nr:hypothetical protein LSH36_187g00020 [Paralvinella palmiformis]
MTDNQCSESVQMDYVGASTDGFNVKTAVTIQPSSSFTLSIITSSIIIIILQFGHAIGLLYVDYLLIINLDLDYNPIIYLEATPSFLMLMLLFLPFLFYNKWRSWLLAGQTDVDVRPGIIIMAFVFSVGLNILAYTVQVVLIVVQLYSRHLARLPSGNRCSCYQSDSSYLTSNISLDNFYKCMCYVPALPEYARKFPLLTDNLDNLTPDTIEKYIGVEAKEPFTEVGVIKYDNEDSYQLAYTKQRFSDPYILVTTILMCNLIILAVRMPLWIKLKELWTESEKHFLAKKIKASSGCVQEGDISLKSCIISACEVTRKLATLDKTYREKKISNISLIKDEFAFAFLEGADAFGLFLDIMGHAYVDPHKPILVAGIIFICIDILLYNWDNLLLVIPVYGERIASYTRATSTIFINVPFFAIRLILLLDEGIRGFTFLLLVLFLMKELTAFVLSAIDLVQMVREDCKNRRAAKTV